MDIKAWKQWVYSKKESHFFCFCDIHRDCLKRRQDGIGSCRCKRKCDYPQCKLKATSELFPNLVTICKNVKRKDLIKLEDL
jgi:hypothetical protein